MNTKLLLSGLLTGTVFTVLAAGGSGGSSAVSSVSAASGHASHTGGFSQPPVTVSSGEASANSTTSDSATAGATSTGSTGTAMGTGGTGTPPPNSNDASFPGFAPSETNAAPTNAEAWSDIIIRTNANGSVTNLNPHMNLDGDVTNANGTMTYDTRKPNWWVKTH